MGNDIKHTPDVDERIARIEAVTIGLAESVEKLSKTVNEISERVSASTKTDWGRLLGLSAIILTIVGMLGSGYVRDMNRVEAVADDLVKRSGTTEYERGKTDQQITDLRTHGRDLDERLQREMRQINETTEAKIVALDKRIQTEFGALLAERDKSHARVISDLNEIRSLQGGRIEQITENRERIMALERRVFTQLAPGPSDGR